MIHKQQIFVGNEYKEAFNSISELIKGDCLDKNKYTFYNGVISDGSYEYVLTDQIGDTTQTEKHGFGIKGASWFKALRGETIQNTNAIWTSLMENVKAEFHKSYSIVEYEEKLSTVDQQNSLNNVINFTNNFTDIFFPNF